MDWLRRLPATAALLLCISGCVSYNTPGDLTLTSVKAVDFLEEANRDLPSEGTRLTKAQRLYLKVTFTSGKDYRDFSGGWSGTTIGMTADLCDGSGLYAAIWPWVYSGGVRLDTVEPRPAPALSHGGKGFLYWVLIRAMGEAREISPGHPHFARYDLRTRPQGVCFWINGGSMAGFSYRSNVLRIPAGAIEEALRDIPPQLTE